MINYGKHLLVQTCIRREQGIGETNSPFASYKQGPNQKKIMTEAKAMFEFSFLGVYQSFTLPLQRKINKNEEND